MSLDGWIYDLGAELRAAESRRRAPRRLLRLAVAVATVAAAVAVALAVAPSDDPEIPARPPLPTVIPQVPADTIVERTYMGVSCPEPNRIECDRVGLAVWLHEPARAIEARIGSRRFALDDQEWSGDAQLPVRDRFAGFLQPAGLSQPGPLEVNPGSDGRWLGGEPVSAMVELTVTLASGDRVRTRVEADLRAGWG